MGVAGASGRSIGWLAVGMGAAILAYFTRSAGLPLLVVVGGLLLVARRYRALGAFAVAAGGPMLLWWLRGRSVGEGEYVQEFWMVNPYRPELGTAGARDLLVRVGENLTGYVGRHVPGGLVGGEGPLVALLGIALVAAAAVGWWRWSRREMGAGELFVPLYFGLVLLWPQVWSGDRFVLPLFPLLLFYAGEGLLWAGERLGAVGRATLVGVGLAAVVAPAFLHWTGMVRQAQDCGALVRVEGPWACWGTATRQFVDASRWIGANLPSDAVVLSRKPRLLYVVSGRPSRTYPFSADPDTLLAAAEEAGARYVLLDLIGAQGRDYVGAAITERPGAFCGVGGFGAAGGGLSTQLLGILPPGDRRTGAGEGGEEIRIGMCSEEMAPAEPRPVPAEPTGRIPLLEPGPAEP